MAITISVANIKGGLGKTATVISLSRIAAAAGHKTLVIDFDTNQANTTQSFRCLANDPTEPDLMDVLLEKADIKEAIKKSEFGLDVLINKKQYDDPSIALERYNLFKSLSDNKTYTKAEIDEIINKNQYYMLSEKLALVADDYEYIFIDNSPSAGLTTQLSLAASDCVIIPVHGEGYSYEGLLELIDKINQIKYKCNPELDIAGIVLTNCAHRTTLFATYYRAYRKQFPEYTVKQIIRRDNKMIEACSQFLPIYDHYPRTNAGTDYLNLALELEIISKDEHKKLMKKYGIKNDKLDLDILGGQYGN